MVYLGTLDILNQNAISCVTSVVLADPSMEGKLTLHEDVERIADREEVNMPSREDLLERSATEAIFRGALMPLRFQAGIGEVYIVLSEQPVWLDVLRQVGEHQERANGNGEGDDSVDDEDPPPTGTAVHAIERSVDTSLKDLGEECAD